jgi:PEP-CTERM motif
VMLTAALMSTVSAFADTLDLSLATPIGYGQPGTSVAFYATVEAPITNTGTIFLNSDSFDITGNLSLDDSSFLNTFPFQLDPGQSFTGLLFEVALPAKIALGVPFDGDFEILGGSDGGSLNTIASSNFEVVATPEPSTILLMGSGLLVMAGTVRRKLAI